MRKQRGRRRLFYDVPWCVPQWGRTEWSATVSCFASGRILRGDEPARFAAALRTYLGTPYVLPVNRGRTAIGLALRALGLGSGDEVILPSYICRSAVEGVQGVGAVPVFADVGSDLHLTAETVRGAITPRTKAVIVAHLFGKAAPVDRIERSLRGTGIALIDDAAQSLGARCAGRLVGTFGACGIVSCGPGKALAGSAGGALVTHDARLYERAASVPLQRERAMVVARRVAAFWLWRRFRRFTLPLGVLLERLLGPGLAGVAELPAPISNVEAAIALRQLKGLDAHAQERRHNAERLLERLGELGRASIFDGTPASCAVKLALVLPIERPPAAELVEALAMIGIEAQGGYTPCHLLTEHPRARLPYAERVWRHVVCLPLETTFRKGASLSRCLEDWRRGQSVGRQPVEGTTLDTPPAFGRLS